jgi:RNA polymerase sigma-70 factor (ECF subfamily)
MCGTSFPITDWDIVLRASRPDERTARDILCRLYFHPIRAFIKGQGLSDEDAEDIAQGFLQSLLFPPRRAPGVTEVTAGLDDPKVSARSLADLGPERGSFRSWLRSSARHYLINALKRARTRKRGGLAPHLPLEDHLEGGDASLRLDQDVADLLDGCRLLEITERARLTVREHYARRGKARIFEELQTALWGEKGEHSDAEVAARLGISEGYVRVQRNRLKEDFRRCIHAETSLTEYRELTPK